MSGESISTPSSDSSAPAAEAKAKSVINHRVPVSGPGFSGVFTIKAESRGAAMEAADEMVRRLQAIKIVYG